MAVDAHWRASTSQMSTNSLRLAPAPPSSAGTYALNNFACFRALTASIGKRDSWSTASACGAAKSRATERAEVSRVEAVELAVSVFMLGSQFFDGSVDGVNTFKHAAFKHPVRKFEIKSIFQCQHDVDTGVRGHTRFV